jgi:hypothetical protein
MLSPGFDGGGDFPVQWMSETNYAQSDIPGTPTAQVIFQGMQQGQWNYGWITAQPDTSTNWVPSRWSVSGINDDSVHGRYFTSWTYANL